MQKITVMTTEGNVNPLERHTSNGKILVCTHAQYVRVYAHIQDPTGELCASSPLEGNDDPLNIPDQEVLYVTYALDAPEVEDRDGSILDIMHGTLHVLHQDGEYAVTGGAKFGSAFLWMFFKTSIDRNSYHPAGMHTIDFEDKLETMASALGIKFEKNLEMPDMVSALEKAGMPVDLGDISDVDPKDFKWTTLENIVNDLQLWMETACEKLEKRLGR